MGDIARALHRLDRRYPGCDFHTWPSPPPGIEYHADPDTGHIYLSEHLTGDAAFAALIAAVDDLLRRATRAAVIPLPRSSPTRRRRRNA